MRPTQSKESRRLPACAQTGDTFYLEGERQPQAKSRPSLHSIQQQDKGCELTTLFTFNIGKGFTSAALMEAKIVRAVSLSLVNVPSLLSLLLFWNEAI